MKQTQTSSIKGYLLAGNSLTSMEAFEKFGCTRLSAKIFDLRKSGYNVVAEPINAFNRYGRPVTYYKYYIPKSL